MTIDHLLQRLSKPAQRALQNEGIITLEQLSGYSENEIMALHGIGKNAIAAIRIFLNENGMTFTEK